MVQPALFHCTRTSRIYAGEDFAFSVSGADNIIKISPGLAWMRINRSKSLVAARKMRQALTWACQIPSIPESTARAYPVYGDDTDTNIARKEACGMVSFAARSSSNMNFTRLEEKPSVDIPVTVKVYV